MNNNKNIGILDPKGENLNPLTEKEYSEDYKKLGEIWSKYPAYDMANNIIEDIKSHQVIVITASTGSGKTVLVPKYLLHALDYKGKIAITLPKQIIAKSAAEFSSKTLDVKLGTHVGYQYRGANLKSDETKLLYATDGTIVARLLKDPELKEYEGVIIDEAHERKIQIDFLLYLLRETIRKRKEFKLIIMSATINLEIFRRYFEKIKYKELNIAGKTNYPIESIYLEKSLNYREIMSKGMEILINILDKNEKGDIIFFITSANEAITMCSKLTDEKILKLKKQHNVFCVEVYSGMNPDRQKLAQDISLYKNINNYKTKVVMATNVAESSLTIDGIKYVIDSGYELFGYYDPNKQARILTRKIISQAQAKQRMGRAGRTGPGVCYHLYSKSDFENNMKKYPEPGIRTSDISSECLKLLNINSINNINKLSKILQQFIEPPKENYYQDAINKLFALSAIDNNKITTLGEYLVKYGTNDINTSLAIILSKIYKCSNEIIMIISMIEASKMNMSEYFHLPSNIMKNKKYNEKEIKDITKKYNLAREKIKHKYGDHHSLLNIYKTYELKKNNKEKIKKWSHDNFIKLETLFRADKYNKKYKNQLFRLFNEHPQIYGQDLSNLLNIPYNINIIKLDIDDRILACLLMAYRTNTAVKKTNKEYYKTQKISNIKIKIDDNSFLNNAKTTPKNIFYSEFSIIMDSPKLSIVSKITSKMIDILK